MQLLTRSTDDGNMMHTQMVPNLAIAQTIRIELHRLMAHLIAGHLARFRCVNGGCEACYLYI